ncbi:MAG: hypothetical protein ACYCUV_12865 [Phycisphaerae bacterium]
MTEEPHKNKIASPPSPEVPADEFRALEDALKPDVRQTWLAIHDPETGDWVKKELRHIHWSVNPILSGKFTRVKHPCEFFQMRGPAVQRRLAMEG